MKYKLIPRNLRRGKGNVKKKKNPEVKKQVIIDKSHKQCVGRNLIEKRKETTIARTEFKERCDYNTSLTTSNGLMHIDTVKKLSK